MPTVSDPQTTTREQLKRAFDHYAREGAKMQQLLMELIDQPDAVRMPLIRAQQERLNSAGAEYRDAQDQYIRQATRVSPVRRGLL